MHETKTDVRGPVGLPETEVDHALRGIDPLRHLPAELHEQALGFLEWLAAVDRAEPTRCPYCGSIKFGDRGRGKGIAQRITYRCWTCKQCFNRLTGTAFKGMRHAHLWPAHMTLRFAGWTLPLIASHLKISPHAASRWNRQFLIEMEVRTPRLHDWWITHQRREDLSMPASIQQQADEFLAWIGELTMSASKRAGTPFEYLTFTEHWPSFAQVLVQGGSDRDIERESGVHPLSAARWRRRIQGILIERWPALVAWIHWQRGRRFRAVRTRLDIEKSADDPTRASVTSTV